MSKFKRVFTIVVDSMGIGALPDAAEYGDAGTDTLGHIAERTENFQIPNFQKLGIANLHPLKGVPAAEKPLGYYMEMAEASVGKDTMTGHWEMMGIKTEKPFKTFTDTGFPPELIKELEERTGHKVIGNKSSSGTEILDELAEEEIATGHMIVYTSADSVLQICGNEETFDLEELYRCCKIARELTLKDEWKVGRVIARPYVGKKKGEFKRTSNRHDYALKPFGKTALNALKDAGFDVISIGKINDIFDGEGITKALKSKSSVHGMEQTIEVAGTDFHGLCFVNLVDFDMLYGHRRDVPGYAAAATEFDRFLADFIPGMREGDLLMITADHGCDPSTPSTDHSREYVPLLCCGKSVRAGVDLATRSCFADLAATVGEYFDPAFPGKLQAGSSFLQQLLK